LHGINTKAEFNFNFRFHCTFVRGFQQMRVCFHKIVWLITAGVPLAFIRHYRAPSVPLQQNGRADHHDVHLFQQMAVAEQNAVSQWGLW
jgi:hypothetical protein